MYTHANIYTAIHSTAYTAAMYCEHIYAYIQI